MRHSQTNKSKAVKVTETIPTKTREIPKHILKQLKNPPSRGEGLNTWLYLMALKLHGYRTTDEIIELLKEATSEEAVRYGEIERQVECAAAWKESRMATPTANVVAHKRWIPINKELRQSIIANGMTLEELSGMSPVKGEQLSSLATSEVVDLLYPGNPLLCCSITGKQCFTSLKSELAQSIGRMRYIVPSPMSSQEGLTQEGVLSARSLSNVGPRKYLVIESDTGSLDEQTSVLVHLGKFLRLVMVVHSGNKSLHGWFLCDGKAEKQLHTFMRHAVSLGADKALWNPCQLARIPQGIRENGALQAVQYLNPALIK